VTHRLERLQALLAAQRLDALLVGALPNVRYLTGFTGSAGYLVVCQGGAVLYVDGRYAEQASREFAGGAVTTTPRDILGGVLASLSDRRPARLGVEAAHLSYEAWRRIADTASGVEVAPTAGLVEGLRARKDAEEVAALRRAIAITDQAYEDCLTWIAPGLSEGEVAARCEYFQRSRGADRKETRTAVGSGPRSALPHCIAADRRTAADEPVLLDLGCTVHGYTSDLTRTVFLGRPPEAFVRIHRIVAEAQALAIQAIRPGVEGRAVHAIAAQCIARHGYGDRFPHALGHSIGLNIHERPQLSPTETQSLEPGNVVTVEPGIYLPGRFGVRTEDVVLVTEAGCEMLSRAPRDLATV
jgi:Xaa-Pro aminopeptidase